MLYWLVFATLEIITKHSGLKQQTHFSWFCVLAGCTHLDQLDQGYMAPDDLMHTWGSGKMLAWLGGGSSLSTSLLHWEALPGFVLMVLCRGQPLQSYLTLCNPMDYRLPGSSVHGILQARLLEWVALSSSRGSSPSRVETASLMSPALVGGFFTIHVTQEVLMVVESFPEAGRASPQILILFRPLLTSLLIPFH